MRDRRTGSHRLRSTWLLLAAAGMVVACSSGTATPGVTSAAATTVPAGGATPAAPAAKTATAPTTATSPAAAAGGQTGSTVSSAADLADALGPGDFVAVGLNGADTGSVNNNEAGSVYVVYAGRSSATGGIEFDAFLSATTSDAEATYATVLGGALDAAGMGKKDVPAADDAAMRLDNPIDSGGTYATIAVRKGLLVFDIGIPGNASAEAQLTALALLVLQRTTAVQ